jgi:hypothetical protein
LIDGAATPSGVGPFPSVFRGCRPAASPPANGLYPSGMMKPCSRWDSGRCSSRGNPRWSVIRSLFRTLFHKICTHWLMQQSISPHIGGLAHKYLVSLNTAPQNMVTIILRASFPHVLGGNPGSSKDFLDSRLRGNDGWEGGHSFACSCTKR